MSVRVFVCVFMHTCIRDYIENLRLECFLLTGVGDIHPVHTNIQAGALSLALRLGDVYFVL